MVSSSRLVVFALAAARGLAAELQLADEVALVQRGVDPAASQQAGMPKLLCDDVAGCRYEGLPPRQAKSKPLPIFPSIVPQIDMSQLSKLAEAAKHMPTPAPFQMPDLSKIMQEVAKHVPKPAPQAQQTAAGSPQAPPPFQMPDLSKIGQELAKLHLPVPGVSALQVSASSEEAEVAHFIPDNQQLCVEGTAEYLKEKLPKIKDSPLAAAYTNAEVASGSCASVGYTKGPNEDKCFPLMTIHFSKDRFFNPFSEIMTIAKYKSIHGESTANAALKELCA